MQTDDRQIEIPLAYRRAIAAAARRLEARAGVIAEKVVESHRANVPAYGAIEDPALRADHLAAVEEHIKVLLHYLASDPAPGDLEPLAELGARRFAQGFALSELQQAYFAGTSVGSEVLANEVRSDPGDVPADEVPALITATHKIVSDAVQLVVGAISRGYLAAANGKEGDVLCDLLESKDPNVVSRAAESLGLPPLGIYVCAVMEPESAAAAVGKALLAVSPVLGQPAAGGLVAIVKVGCERLEGDLAGRLTRVMQSSGPESFSAAVGRAHAGMAGIAESYREALTAHLVLQEFPDLGPALRWRHCLPYAVMLGRTELIRPLIQETIGPVLAHDAVSANKLLPILEEYLNARARTGVACEKLHVDPTTVRRDLAKIEKLTRMSMDDPRDLFCLVVAVRLARMRSWLEP